MKRAVFLLTLAAVLLYGGAKSAAEKRKEAAIEKAIEKEKIYAKEQKFYQADEYDFKSTEVDPASLESIEPIEVDVNHTDDWGACDNK